MNELEHIFIEMLNHIDDHKEAYNKPQWTNEAIVKTWIKTNESKLKNLFISSVVNCVYVVTERDNYGEQLFKGVFANKEKAIEHLIEKGLRESNIYEINEIELD